ncbi:hypothetical protein C8J57DRAFT_1498892 [Mycena rebaudengoi]|nr:hypothetical protein C8J57DRAFT_1498892 [Mycena rebaudengoi]
MPWKLGQFIRDMSPRCRAGWLMRKKIQTGLWSQVSDLSRELAHARFKAEMADEIISHQKSIIASRRRLPLETLTDIFVLALEMLKPHYYLRLLVLLRVCSAWRHVLLHDSRFWSVYDLNSSSTTRREQGWGVGARHPSQLGDFTTLITALSRSQSHPLDVTLAIDKLLSLKTLQHLVDVSSRWRHLRIDALQELCPNHEFRPVLSMLENNLGVLERLVLAGLPTYPLWPRAGDGLWKGDEVEDGDILPSWFAQTSNLTSLRLQNMFYPEATITLPWQQLLQYAEADTRRPRQAHMVPSGASRQFSCNTIPHSHLEAMSNLTHLWLENVVPPDPQYGTVSMPSLRSLSVIFLSGWRTEPLTMYDRLEAFIVPALQHLEVSGEEFAEQEIEHERRSFKVHHSIDQLLTRSNGSHLTSLSVALNTGLTDRMCTSLLKSIRSLRELEVVDSNIMNYEGILTKNFLHDWQTLVMPLEVLRVGRALGYPHYTAGWLKEGEDVQEGADWVNQLIAMLTFQFSHSLAVMDLRSTRPFFCALKFPEEASLALEPTSGHCAADAKPALVPRPASVLPHPAHPPIPLHPHVDSHARNELVLTAAAFSFKHARRELIGALLENVARCLSACISVSSSPDKAPPRALNTPARSPCTPHPHPLHTRTHTVLVRGPPDATTPLRPVLGLHAPTARTRTPPTAPTHPPHASDSSTFTRTPCRVESALWLHTRRGPISTRMTAAYLAPHDAAISPPSKRPPPLLSQLAPARTPVVPPVPGPCLCAPSLHPSHAAPRRLEYGWTSPMRSAFGGFHALCIWRCEQERCAPIHAPTPPSAHARRLAPARTVPTPTSTPCTAVYHRAQTTEPHCPAVLHFDCHHLHIAARTLSTCGANAEAGRVGAMMTEEALLEQVISLYL